MGRRVLLAVIAGCAALAAVPGTALAGTLDQQQTESDGVFGVFMRDSSAQSFTAALSGGLDQVDLKLAKVGAPTAPLTVEIRNLAAVGDPGTAVLARANLPASAVLVTEAFVPVLFTAPAPVTAGTKYAIVTYSTTSSVNRYNWSKKGTNAYPGGGPFGANTTPPGANWNAFTAQDTAFKTYVAVPVSASTSLPPGSTGPTGFCGGQPATKVGTEGADVIAGSSGVDVIAGLGGNDRISGLGGKDVICGGDGNDKLKGGGGNDKLLGQKGKDTLKGGPGKDKLKGGPGKDKQIQ